MLSTNLFITIGMLIVAYLLGSIPMGLLVVKLFSGKDVRDVGSGRTGGTNAMRAAGFWAGFTTAMLDVLKGAVAVWLMRLALQNEWPFAHVLAGATAVLGHNYSLFLSEFHRDEKGKLHIKFGGGAGGAPAVGGATGLWVWSPFIIIPLGALILFGIGYASVTTLSVGLLAILILSILALLKVSPWMYVLYGFLVLVLQIWALRPNLVRLMNGTERLVGWRAKRLTGKMTADPTQSQE
ncbi:MAG TPA: glycerol-3-phosphate acyltransferase [Anaerolineales bacterium]|nr:glycerol-3-phosphate acyltransferase [Anaerolineales bacterium]